VVSTAASQHQGTKFDSRLGSLSVWRLHILPVSAWVSSGYSGFLPELKDVWVRSIGHAKIDPTVRGISRLNMWGYGNRAWVVLLLVQSRWAEWPPSVLEGFYDSMKWSLHSYL